ncbi:hypothetical protein B0H13DRAFT_1558728, partial [Mycena leptocephala]
RKTDAEPLNSIILEKQKQLLGADHPDMLEGMANLTATHHRLGSKFILGEEHPDTLRAMANLLT